MSTECQINGATDNPNFIIRVNGNLQVVVGADGSVALGSGVTAQGAAVIFWNAVADHARAQRTRNDTELRAIAADLRRQGLVEPAERILAVVEEPINV